VPEQATCNCVLLCDDVVTTAKGKQHLSGVINTIYMPGFPAVVGGYVTYVRISNVYGSQTVQISLAEASSGNLVIGFDAQLQPPDPLGVATVVAVLPPFVVKAAGRYIFQVTHGGVPIGQSPIMILDSSPPHSQQQPQPPRPPATAPGDEGV